MEGIDESGLTKEEEEELTPLLTQLVRDAARSKTDKVKIKVTYREEDIPLLLTVPPTLADFNKQIHITYNRPLNITAPNSKRNVPLEVSSDDVLRMVIRKYSDRDKVPLFTLTDKHILDGTGANRISSIEHLCQPGTSKAKTVFRPRVIQSLGEGSSAKVELVRCAKTGALFAMKRISNSDGRKANREIEAFTTVKSRRLVQLNKVYNEGEYVKLVMEYMPGGSLYKMINEGNRENEYPPLSWDLIHKYTRELLEGVNDIHMAGYLHMDIKPLNLVIDIDGSLKITDFGSFTKIGSSDFSCELTPIYASPEALAKNSPWEGSCDIWSVGVTILEMILGRVPWSNVPRNEMELLVFIKMEEIIEKELSDVSLPPHIRKILEQALVIDPLQRSNACQLLSLC